MNDDGQKKDESNKTLMFDPAQTEAFKKMARLARQQAEQGQPGTSSTSPQIPAASVPGTPAPARPAPVVDEGNANKTMMFGAAELAQVRPGGVPLPSAPARPAAPETVAIDPNKTMIFSGPLPVTTPVKPVPGVPDELAALSSGMDAAFGNPVAPQAPVQPQAAPGGTQFYVPAVNVPTAGGGGETVAYSPEQMARIRQGMQPSETGGQTMLYNVNENPELKEAFDLLKRHQAMEAERSTQARAEAEALLRGIGNEPAPAATVPLMEAVAAPQPTTPASPLAAPAPGSTASRAALPLTAAPAQPRQGAMAKSGARFETGTPRKSNAGKVILVILLVAAGAALVAFGLDYLELIELPFLK